MAEQYTYNHSEANIATLIQALCEHDIKYTLDQTSRSARADTQWSPSPPAYHPLLVIFPTSTEQTSLTLAACYTRRIAVTSHSGGTSFGGALAAVRGGVCVSFEKMNRVLKVGESDLDVTVQAGVGWVDLNERLRNRGVWFPVDPSPGAKIGGMVAMSCSGTNAYRYGTMKENVISLICVLANGDVVKTHGRPRKSAAGYDLTHLIIGSEGTLALVTEAVLRLHPLPRNLHVGLATFDTFQQGVDIVVALQKHGHKIEALELADGPQMHCVNFSRLAKMKFEETPTLFMKFASPSKQIVDEQIYIIETLCKGNNAKTFEVTNSNERVNIIWGARKCMGTALTHMKRSPTDLFLHSDCAVPISNLAALVAGTQSLIQTASGAASSSTPWFCANVGHIGDGNVHSSIVCPAEDREAAENALRDVARLALRLEGTVTGEHGVGIELREALEEEVGSVGVGVMRRIKRVLDERGILNPDKVFKLVGQEEGGKAKL